MSSDRSEPTVPSAEDLKEFLRSFGMPSNAAAVERLLWSYENAVTFWEKPEKKVPARTAKSVKVALALVRNKIDEWPSLANEEHRRVLDELYRRADIFAAKGRRGKKPHLWQQALFASLADDLQSMVSNAHWRPRSRLLVDEGLVCAALAMGGVEVANKTVRDWAAQYLEKKRKKRGVTKAQRSSQ